VLIWYKKKDLPLRQVLFSIFYNDWSAPAKNYRSATTSYFYLSIAFFQFVGVKLKQFLIKKENGQKIYDFLKISLLRRLVAFSILTVNNAFG